jgi:hypothetical protein
MNKKPLYPQPKMIRFTEQQEKDGVKLAVRRGLTFNQLIRDLLDSAIKIDGITRSMK